MCVWEGVNAQNNVPGKKENLQSLSVGSKGGVGGVSFSVCIFLYYAFIMSFFSNHVLLYTFNNNNF